MLDATAEREIDAMVFDCLRKRNKWAGRIAFAERAQAANARAIADPGRWIDELLEIEAILG